MQSATGMSFSKEVLSSDQPVLVDFWAPWCMPCRMLAPVIESVASEYAGRLKVVKVNIDENQHLGEQYGIMAIPTMMFFRNGAAVHRIAGMMPERQLRQVIDRLLAG